MLLFSPIALQYTLSIYRTATVSYENVSTRPRLRCALLIKLLVKSIKFIKFDFLTFLNLEVLLNFSVKLLNCTLTTRKWDTTKITFAGMT